MSRRSARRRWTPAKSLTVTIVVFAFTAVAGCSNYPGEPWMLQALRTRYDHSPRGLWVLLVNGGPLGDHIQLLQVESSADGSLTLTSLPTLSWTGDSVNDMDGASLDSDAEERGTYNWRIRLRDASVLAMAYTISADTLRGQATLAHGGDTLAFPVLGVRIDPHLLPLGARPLPPSEPDSTPVIVLRLDDAPASDREIVGRLRDRALGAEIAVPTEFVGRRSRLTWPEIQVWSQSGFAIVAHSRRHSEATATDADFIGEVLGSMLDLARLGIRTRVFVQPGVWRGSLNFDDMSKLQTWRGALLRSFCSVAELYQTQVPLARPWPDHAIGLSHQTISDGITDKEILELWSAAQQKNRITVFLIHSFNLRPISRLDWFLDTLAAGKAGGRIRLAGSAEEALSQ
jgi:hypothetical protein